MENTVTLSLVEYEMLAGIKKDFDEKLNSELKRLNDADRAFVLRDRDEYVRRAELLFKEKTEAQEKIRKVSEENVKLRVELDMLKGKLETLTENEKALLDEIDFLHEKRNEALAQYDALLGRRLFARIFNRG